MQVKEWVIRLIFSEQQAIKNEPTPTISLISLAHQIIQVKEWVIRLISSE
jgi:hypothetical protein